MRIHMIAVGSKMPNWVNEAFHDYAKRLPKDCALVLNEIPLVKRGKNTSVDKAKQKECEHILAAIPKNSHVVALEVTGKAWSTEQLAQELNTWRDCGGDVCLLIGGPDGLDGACRDVAQQLWSLSALTLPHPLVRVVIAEQIYRAWSINNNHPYHR